MDLLIFTKKGIYCPPADVYIDPWKPVNKALITHGHSDHSRRGHQSYLCHNDSVNIIKNRLGKKISIEGIGYDQSVTINGVKFSFHPAGHIVGSAQIRVEYQGEVWVASGDYKIEADGLSPAFEPVKCDVFITESTFGLPVFRWPKQEVVFDQINQWWQQCNELGKIPVLTAYSLGKAQRLLQSLDTSIGPIFTSDAIEDMNEAIRAGGISLKPSTRISDQLSKEDINGGLMITTSVTSLPKTGSYSIGAASGWMAMRSTRKWRSADRSFVLSDHADWDDLNWAVKETGAQKVIVTHGYMDSYAKWLCAQGIEGLTEKTQFEAAPAELSDTVQVERI